MTRGNHNALRVGEGSTGDPAEVAAIIEVIRKAALAVVHGDPDGVADMFAQDESVTSFDFMQPGLTTVADIRNNVENIARTAAGPVVMRYPLVTVHVVSPDFAWSLAYGELDLTNLDGTKTDLRMSVTDIWRKLDGRWRAVHEHTSLPADMANGSVILKQEP